MLLSDVCLSLSVAYVGPKSRTERPRKHRDSPRRTGTPLSRSKGQKSRSTGRFTQRGLNAYGGCSGQRGNIGPYSVCRKVLLRCICSAAREALERPRGRRGAGAYCVATRTACFRNVSIEELHHR